MNRPTMSTAKATQAVLVALVLITLGLFLFLGSRAVGFPYPLDYGEGPLLDQALRLADGNNIYESDLSRAPFTVSNYPPLFVGVVAGAARLFGPAYWYGRALSMLSGLIAAIACGAIVLRLTGERIAAVTTAGCFLAMPYVGFWSALFRVDSLALALSLCALALLPENERQQRRLLAVGLLLTLAAFTRQSYALAAPLVALAALTANATTRRMAPRLLLIVGLLGGALFLGLQWATGGGFWFHVVTANINEFSLARSMRYLREIGLLMPCFVVLPTVALIVGRKQRPACVLIGSYTLAALASGLTIGKLGSNVNYMLELCAACAIGCGWLLATVRRADIYRTLVSVAIALQLAFLLGGTRYRQHLDDKLARREQQASLFEFVQRAPGTLLADDAAGFLPLAGKPIEFQPFEMTQLAAAGAWDPTPLLARMEQHEFSAILIQRVPWSPIHRTRWTPAMLECIEQHYEPRHRLGHTVVYLPREYPSLQRSVASRTAQGLN